MIARLLRALAAFTALALPGAALAQSAPSDFTSAVRYDDLNRVTGTIAPDPDGTGPLHYAATRTTYDAAGRAVLVEKGELSAWQPESIAPSAWSGFAIWQRVETSYDGLDRKTVESLSGWDTATSGWLTSEVTQYSYDAVGRPECTAQRMNPATWSALPASACALAATSATYGPDRIVKNVYDDAGQLLSVQKGVGTALVQDYVKYTYTPSGKPASVRDANGFTATYVYDGFDRLAAWHFPDPATGAVSSTDYYGYAYDANGNKTAERKRGGPILYYSYDNLNRLTLKDIPSWAGADTYYGYDARGQQLYARFGSASGAGITNSYDGFGRLASSSNDMGGAALTLSYQYDADGNRKRLDWPGGVYVTYDYDGFDRLSAAQWYTSAFGPVPFFANVYDALGRRTTRYQASSSTSYAYDAVSRLASDTQGFASGSSNLVTSYAYNPADQVVGRTRSNTAYSWTGYVNVSRSYTVNGLNQYTAAGAATFAYNGDGNLTGDGTSTYSYDVENRLTGKSGGLAIAYDPLGRLWQTSGGASGTTRYLYDGDQLVAEYSGTGAMTARYFFGPGVDEPVLWDGGGMDCSQSRFLHPDAQGSIIAVANCWGGPIATNAYDEYGIPAAGNIGRFQYTGQIWLPDLGMYYYKARMYSPSLGRFMQTDPIGYADQNNLYAYVGNDPMDRSDPSGLATVCAATTGSIIGACVGVDGNGDGSVKDNDLSFSQKSKIASDFRGAITALSGRGINDISGFGKPVLGTASETDKAMTRVVSQFIGASVTGNAKTQWSNVMRIQADARSYWGEAAGYRPLMTNGIETNRGKIVLGGRLGWFFGGYLYDSPSNLARALLHETGHTRIGFEAGGDHDRIDDSARALLKTYGLNGGGCWSTGVFPGC